MKAADSFTQQPVLIILTPDVVVHSERSSVASGPARCVWPNSAYVGRRPSVASTSPYAINDDWRSITGDRSGLNGPNLASSAALICELKPASTATLLPYPTLFRSFSARAE